MVQPDQPGEVVRNWTSIPDAIRKAIEGLPESDLDLRGGPNNWSIRESVHHLVEANLVASNIVLAALGKSGCTYDWSWLTPGGSWMERLGYNSAPIGPAVDLLEALCRHVTALLTVVADGMERSVKLLDAPGADTRTTTVEEILLQESKHAKDHLGEVAEQVKKRKR